MFLLIVLLVGGITYNAVERAAPYIALGILLSIPMAGVIWVSDTFGFTALVNGSWQFLSGVSGPGEVIPNCPVGSEPTAWVMILWILPILNAIPGMIGIVGLPVGAVWAFVGGLRYLYDESYVWLRDGVGIFTIGMAGVVVAGLMMRLMHALYLGIGCS